MATADPDRMYLTNLDSGDLRRAQYNPTEWEYTLAANYVEVEVPGMPMMPTHYHHTENPEIPLNLLLAAEDPAELDTVDERQRWLESFLYPWRGKTRPPRILLSWPGEASLTCEMRKFAASRKRFNAALRTVEMEIKLTLKHIRGQRPYGDDVARDGLKRAALP